ncbi:MAG: hypothetical protein ACI3XR_02930 [Eubacteriales bacterium]
MTEMRNVYEAPMASFETLENDIVLISGPGDEKPWDDLTGPGDEQNWGDSAGSGDEAAW